MITTVQKEQYKIIKYAAMVELEDTGDLKSPDFIIVRVQIPLAAPQDKINGGKENEQVI